MSQRDSALGSTAVQLTLVGAVLVAGYYVYKLVLKPLMSAEQGIEDAVKWAAHLPVSVLEAAQRNNVILSPGNWRESDADWATNWSALTMQEMKQNAAIRYLEAVRFDRARPKEAPAFYAAIRALVERWYKGPGPQAWRGPPATSADWQAVSRAMLVDYPDYALPDHMTFLRSGKDMDIMNSAFPQISQIVGGSIPISRDMNIVYRT